MPCKHLVACQRCTIIKKNTDRNNGLQMSRCPMCMTDFDDVILVQKEA